MWPGASAPGKLGDYRASAPIGPLLIGQKRGRIRGPASLLRRRRLGPGHLRNLDHVDRRSRHLQEGLILSKYSRRLVRRFRLDNGIAADVVLGVLDSLRVDALGLSDRGAAIRERRLVIFHPFHPRLRPLFSLFWRGLLHHLGHPRGVGHVQSEELLQGVSPCVRCSAAARSPLFCPIGDRKRNAARADLRLMRRPRSNRRCCGAPLCRSRTGRPVTNSAQLEADVRER
jgi:hypothetical protein